MIVLCIAPHIGGRGKTHGLIGDESPFDLKIVCYQVRETANVIQMAMRGHKQVDRKGRSMSEDLFQLAWNGVMPGCPPEIGRMATIHKNGTIPELAEDAVAILLCSDIEQIKAKRRSILRRGRRTTRRRRLTTLM